MEENNKYYIDLEKEDKYKFDISSELQEESIEFKVEPLTKDDKVRIRKQQLTTTIPALRILKNIQTKSSTNIDVTFKDLYKLLYDPDFLAHILSNIMKKPGSLSLGTDKLNTDSINYKTIIKISQSLKQQNYKFNPIRRVFIDKTGKDPDINKKAIKLYKENQLDKAKMKEMKIRPLGVLTTTDKIIAEGIRLILEAIYEPEFERLNFNFGFRPKKSCVTAINFLENKAKAHKFAIEADITGAFDNVNHDILLRILSKKIKDPRFLKLIKDGLKSGMLFAGSLEQTKIGTTQGSNVSPLLYNIYFHEFDLYIHTEFETYIKNLNIGKFDTPKNPVYTKITKEKAKLLKKIKPNTEKLTEIYYAKKFYREKYYKLLAENKELIKRYKDLDKKQKITPNLSLGRQTIRYTYIRYADDWILTTNASLEQTTIFKEMFAKWIKENLALDLSETKTKITPLTKKQFKAHFLGFSLSYFCSTSNYVRRTNITRDFALQKTSFKGIKFSLKATDTETTKKPTSTRRIATPSLIISIDSDRVLPRLIEARFVKKKRSQYFGRSKPEWSILSVHDIIERYNQIIRGYLNYYGPSIKYKSELNFLLYLFQYSCLHTLANKFNTKISKIIRKFGKSPSISLQIKNKKSNLINERTITKKYSLIDWQTAKEIIDKSTSEQRARDEQLLSFPRIDDIPTIKYNWRTKYKLIRHCCICGSTQNIEYHHVRHIKVGKSEGFLQVMKQLNRKQIPTCHNCHVNIHKGLYDGIKLTDLYDEQLIVL